MLLSPTLSLALRRRPHAETSHTPPETSGFQEVFGTAVAAGEVSDSGSVRVGFPVGERGFQQRREQGFRRACEVSDGGGEERDTDERG